MPDKIANDIFEASSIFFFGNEWVDGGGLKNSKHNKL